MSDHDIGEIKKELAVQRQILEGISQQINSVFGIIQSGKRAVQAVPQRSQPPQPKKVVQDLGWHKKRIGTYYSRCFSKSSEPKTIIDNCEKVLQSIAIVLPHTTKKTDIDKLKERQKNVSEQLRIYRAKNTNVRLRRV